MPSPDVEPAARTPFHVRTHGSSPFPSVSLSHEHVSDALKRSPDDGATLDFAKQNLTDIGESGVEELATIGREDVEDQSSVLRVALSNNRLTTLPLGFALLSRLRYLNLKNNNFSVFPEVLTVMPSLDTLDVSHNKIKRLPSQPGSLINLRVFCFSRNKVNRIPSNFSQFLNLDILKSDRNPIEWPPKSVMEPQGGLATAQGMKDWIRSVQKWLEINTSKTDVSTNNDGYFHNDQFGPESNIEDRKSWRHFPGDALHSRSFSRDSNFSMSSIEESQQEIETPPASSLQLERLNLSHLHSRGPSPSPSSRTPENYLPSPEESADESFSVVSNIIRQQQHHFRNSSHIVDRHSPTRSDLLGKKSMPDLRTAKINFSRKAPDPAENGTLDAQDLPNNILSLDDFSIPSPLSQRHDSGSSDEPHPTRPAKSFARDPVGQSSTSSDQPAPSMELERNSYFRRFSALTSTIASTTIPEPLLRLIDSARSILFAVSQVYQTLQHYTVFVIDDRLSSVLRKVLDPASADMMQLINSLDRFDSVSRKTLPPPVVCRAVVESCKDTVAAFSKAVGVLSLQLKVLASRDDVRYLRQMVLVLYGATAEIAYAWQAMVPHIETVKPLLHEHRRPPPAKSHLGHSPTTSAFFTEPDFSSPNGSNPTERPSLSRTHSEDVIGALELGRTHTARRHAGSFSSKDVEIGKILPSYEEVPFLSTGLVSGVATRKPALRVAKRKLTAAPSNLVPPSPSSSSTSPPQPLSQPSTPRYPANAGTAMRPGKLPSTIHSRQGSQSSLQAPSTPSLLPANPPKPHIDISSNSRSLVDKEALDAMRIAVEAAPAVWEMVNEILADFLETNIEVRESLMLAKIVTKRLKENILAVQQGDVAADRKNLREDAHLFVKTVVQLSNVIKIHGSSHAMSSALRTKMVTLTNSTEEFVILLHVSSFSPATSRSPMFSPSLPQASPLGLSGGTEDSRLGASLSRSRNNQSGLGMKFTMPFIRDGSRSALPNQSFNVPAIPRLQGRRGTSFDEEVLG